MRIRGTENALNSERLAERERYSAPNAKFAPNAAATSHGAHTDHEICLHGMEGRLYTALADMPWNSSQDTEKHETYSLETLFIRMRSDIIMNTPHGHEEIRGTRDSSTKQRFMEERINIYNLISLLLK